LLHGFILITELNVLLPTCMYLYITTLRKVYKERSLSNS